MNRRFPGLAAAFAVAALAACSNDVVAPLSPAVRSAVSSNSGSGEYMILVKSSGSAKSVADAVLALGGSVQGYHEGAGIVAAAGLSDAAVKKLGGNNGVQAIQSNVQYSLSKPLAEMESELAADEANSQATPATAARYVWQWNMRLIHANTAWAAGHLGSSTVTAAIIDTGLDYDINDLNGLVDLSRSKNFVAVDSALQVNYFPTRNPVTDMNGHGTNVATQVSSKAVALAGVTSKTTLIGVKVLDWQGNGNTSRTFLGILWAADHGANVANLSLGSANGFAKNDPDFRGLLPFTNRIMNYAHSHKMLVVVSAGNESHDFDSDGNLYKAYCNAPHVVCVSAVGPTTATGNPDAFAWYSNYGLSGITVAAPGGNYNPPAGTVSAWPWGNDIASWVWSYCPKNRIASVNSTTGVPTVTACAAGTRLSGVIGTSQAAPHVTGLAALLMAENPGMPIDAIADIIKSTAVDAGPAGPDAQYGNGRIDVAAALGL